jgi:hypothetical protein
MKRETPFGALFICSGKEAHSRFRAGREDLASILWSEANRKSARCTEAVSFEKCNHVPAPGAIVNKPFYRYPNRTVRTCYYGGMDEITSGLTLTAQPFQKRNLIQDADDFNGNIADIDQSVHSYIWNQHRALYLTSIIGSSILFSVLVVIEVVYFNQIARFFNGDIRIMFIPLFAFFWPFSVYTKFKMRIQHLFMGQIAQVLGFTHEIKGNPASVTGKMLNIGHDKKVEDVMTGIYQGYPIRIYDYTYTIGYGKGSHTESRTVFEVTFHKELPDIFLCPSSGLFTSSISSTDVPIQLEGDFNKYFSLYAPKNYNMEIRVIFQPDLMAKLIDNYRTYSIEIFENKLYVIAPLLTNKVAFLATHDLVDSLYVKILPSLQEVA